MTVGAHAKTPWGAWIIVGVILMASALGMRVFAPLFAYEAALEDMPILVLVVLFMGITAICTFGVPMIIRKTPTRATTPVFVLILGVGIVVRLLQIGTPTILEDDYNRYLWDGAVTAAGYSAFEYAPADVRDGLVGAASLHALAQQGAPVVERINYPEYRTVYPPVAQAAFAVSYLLAPFDLDGWRLMLFVVEVLCLALICAVLGSVGKSHLWAALYWWNPLVIKEVANSAHMEPVLMLPVLLGVYAVLRRKTVWASAFFAIAAGVKVWPLMLCAALWRQQFSARRVLVASVILVVAIIGLVSWPIVTSGLNETSGFVAFAKNWQASSAAFLISEWLTVQVPLAPRVLLGLSMLTVIVAMCWRKAKSAEHLIWQIFMVVTVIYLLSPSQTPWYFLWIAPFLCVFPVRGLMLAGVLLPLHYLYFHLALNDQVDVYRYGVVWLIWCPVWVVLIYDAIRVKSFVKPQVA